MLKGNLILIWKDPKIDPSEFLGLFDEVVFITDTELERGLFDTNMLLYLYRCAKDEKLEVALCINRDSNNFLLPQGIYEFSSSIFRNSDKKLSQITWKSGYRYKDSYDL